MYRFTYPGLALLIFASQVHAAGASTVEKEIAALEQAWTDAWLKKDIEFLKKYYADEYLDISADGTTYTKAEEIALAASGRDNTESATISDVKVHVYGDTVVVRGISIVKEMTDGKDVTGTRLYTDVWIKRDGRWQVVNSQVTPLPKT